MKRLRCAIYTRKSSEEGLDQAFNSLDAQREACEAYIKSHVVEVAALRLKRTRLPLSWAEQRRLLGFES